MDIPLLCKFIRGYSVYIIDILRIYIYTCIQPLVQVLPGRYNPERKSNLQNATKSPDSSWTDNFFRFFRRRLLDLSESKHQSVNV